MVIDMDCNKCIHTDVCSGRFDVEVYGCKCEEYAEVDNRVEKIIEKLETLKISFKERQTERKLYLGANQMEYFFELLIDWIKEL